MEGKIAVFMWDCYDQGGGWKDYEGCANDVSQAKKIVRDVFQELDYERYQLVDLETKQEIEYGEVSEQDDVIVLEPFDD